MLWIWVWLINSLTDRGAQICHISCALLWVTSSFYRGEPKPPWQWKVHHWGKWNSRVIVLDVFITTGGSRLIRTNNTLEVIYVFLNKQISNSACRTALWRWRCVFHMTSKNLGIWTKRELSASVLHVKGVMDRSPLAWCPVLDFCAQFAIPVYIHLCSTWWTVISSGSWKKILSVLPIDQETYNRKQHWTSRLKLTFSICCTCPAFFFSHPVSGLSGTSASLSFENHCCAFYSNTEPGLCKQAEHLNNLPWNRELQFFMPKILPNS